MTPLKNLKRRFSPPVLLISSLQPVDHIPYGPSSQRWAELRLDLRIQGSKVWETDEEHSSPVDKVSSMADRWVDWCFRTLPMASPSSLKHIFERFKTGSSKIPCTPTKINVYRYMESEKNQGKFGNQPFSGSKINLLGCMTWHLWNHNIYLLVMWEPQTQTQSYQSGRKNARNHCAHKVVISKYMEYGIGHLELAKKRRFFCFINPLWCIFGMVMHFDHTHISIEIKTAIQNRSKQLHRSQG